MYTAATSWSPAIVLSGSAIALSGSAAGAAAAVAAGLGLSPLPSGLPRFLGGATGWLALAALPCSHSVTVPLILLCFADVYRTANRLEEALYAFLILIV
jgi:DNA-binding transcriptional LysR family regulator